MRNTLIARSFSVLVALAAIAGRGPAAWAETVDFEDLGLAANSYWNGSDNSGGFTSRGARFNNTFVDGGGGVTSWGGWAYSTKSDTTDPSFNNQYSALAGGGYNSLTYGVGYMDSFTPVFPTIELPAGTRLVSAMFANTTYAGLIMRDGDPNGLAHKFGHADYFKVIVTGLDANQKEIGPLEVFLAQGTDILSTWKPVDLSSLAEARSLRFAVDSSDKDPIFGLNTPAYFAMDDLAVARVPEPSAAVLIMSGLITSGLGLLIFARRLRRT